MPNRSTRFTTTQQQTVHAKFLNSEGTEVPIDGIPTWSSSDETVVTIVPDVDGRSAIIRSGAVGIATIAVVADALLGEGDQQITGTFQVEIIPDEAVSVDFEFDPPVRKE